MASHYLHKFEPAFSNVTAEDGQNTPMTRHVVLAPHPSVFLRKNIGYFGLQKKALQLDAVLDYCLMKAEFPWGQKLFFTDYIQYWCLEDQKQRLMEGRHDKLRRNIAGPKKKGNN
jgi:hypothetical protein